VPFDQWHGTMPNERGRVMHADSQDHVPGLYAVGWIKRGPSGVIGTNKRDAQETTALVLEDRVDGRLAEPEDPSRESVEAMLAERVEDLVTYEGWQAIDAAERAAGEPQGRPRVKLARWEDLIEASRDGS
jgi:ferredoxin--NADP+ reductase